jgi:hypothetical protein
MARNSDRLDAIREAKEERLHHLELRAAREGANTPAEVAIEIDDLRRELAPVQAVTLSPVSDNTLDALNAYGRLEATMRAVMSLTADVAELKTDNKTDRAQRIERQHRVDLLLVGLFCAVVALGVLQLVR